MGMRCDLEQCLTRSTGSWGNRMGFGESATDLFALPKYNVGWATAQPTLFGIKKAPKANFGRSYGTRDSGEEGGCSGPPSPLEICWFAAHSIGAPQNVNTALAQNFWPVCITSFDVCILADRPTGADGFVKVQVKLAFVYRPGIRRC